MGIAIDIGNSFISIGIFKKKEIINHFFLKTSKEKTKDEYGIILINLLKLNNILIKNIKYVVISSVVPNLDKIFKDIFNIYFNLNPLFVNSSLNLGIKLKVDNINEVGSDLIADSVCAYFKYGGNCIIINCGTATKCSIITNKGEFLGVSIAPGYEISKEALFLNTALLQYNNFKIPKNIIGKNTSDAIDSGLYFGYQGLIKNLINLSKETFGRNLKVILTGGLSEFFKNALSTNVDFVNSDLTLQGLKIIYDKNKNKIY